MTFEEDALEYFIYKKLKNLETWVKNGRRKNINRFISLQCK